MTRSARTFLPARRPMTYMPGRRATIDPTLGKKAATGAPLASRPIEGGPALPSPQEYNPIIDAESGEDPNAPRVETQQPIENRGASARYMIQGGGPRIDLSFLVPERANPNFDPSKAIGGENVPYQESKGIGGFFRRLLGDESNRMNIEAQQAQGAEWRDKAAREEERLAGIETYRTQRGIDKEIEDARDEKRNAQAITMFDKAQAAQKELLQLQQDFTKAQSADERAAILDRIKQQHTNALNLQTRALAASEKNLGLQQAFQTRMANFNAQLDDYANQNKITALGNNFFSRGGEVYGLTPGTPGYGNVKGTEPSVTDPLLGPAGKGRQLPQMSVDGSSSAPIRSPRFQVPSISNQGGMLEAPVEPLAGEDVYGSTVRTQPRPLATRTNKPPTPEPAPEPLPMPQPTPDTEEGEYVKGLVPSIGEYMTSDTEAPSLAQDAPGTAPYRAGFGRAMGDIGRSVSEGARSVKPLLFGGKLPRYSEDTGGGVLGAFLNAPGAMFTPVEAAGNYVMRNPVTALTGADPRTGQPILQKAQSPDTLYMTDEQYKNYLRKQRRGL